MRPSKPQRPQVNGIAPADAISGGSPRQLRIPIVAEAHAPVIDAVKAGHASSKAPSANAKKSILIELAEKWQR